MASRRRFLAAAPAAALAGGWLTQPSQLRAQLPQSEADPHFVVTSGRIRQSVMGWCFAKYVNPVELGKFCQSIGLVAMEGIPQSSYSDVKALGLEISLVSSHGFAKGPCDPKYYDEVISTLRKSIAVAKDVGCAKVITFTGMRFDGMDDEKAIADCLRAWKSVLPDAEKAGVTLVLEHLNSRDGSKPMMGHPGYFGDDVEFCFDLIKRIGSPNFKLLFDIYHVSIMNGDIIRRIRQYHELIGHYHTAGNPGRCELDDTQEINYPPILREILKTGYTGYVAQEFIPTWSDPLLALQHAAQVCDV